LEEQKRGGKSRVWLSRLGGNLDWQVVAMGDFDSDGKSGLLWKQWSTAYHAATVMDELSWTSDGWIGGDADWAVQAVP
jgi:hypothetical protein